MKHVSRRNLLGVSLAVPAALALAACGEEKAAPATGEDKKDGANKDEAALVVYNAQHKNLTKAWIDAFTAKTGIKVEQRDGDDTEMANQLITEGDKTPADVFLTENSPAQVMVANKDLLAPVSDTVKQQVEEQFRPASGKWTGVAARSTVFVYDKRKLNESNLPKSIDDLVKPEWKGRWAASPTGADFQAIVAAILELKGEDFTKTWLQGMKENCKPYKGNSTCMKAVNAGEVEGALIYHYYLFNDQKKGGENSANVGEHYFKNGGPGSFVSISGGSVLKASKNQENAQKFLEFVTGPEGQKVLEQVGFEYPIDPKAPLAKGLTPIADLKAPKVNPDQLDAAKVVELMTAAGIL